MITLVDGKDFDFDRLFQHAWLEHTTEEGLSKYLSNKLDEFEQARAAAHLKRCLICERRAQIMREILALGAVEQSAGVCESFRAQMARFSRRSQEEKAREAPELLAHMKECYECRRSYWVTEPLWLDKLRQAGDFISKMLVEKLELAINQAGRLLQTGVGPPASYDPLLYKQMNTPVFTYLEADIPSADATSFKEWRLVDDEAGCALRLTVSARTQEQIALSCALESDPTVNASPALTRIEARRVETGSLYVGGPPSYFCNHPIILTLGAWHIRVQATSGERTFVWEVPLALRTIAA